MTAMDLASIDHLLTTTRAVRKRLDLTRPVPRSVILECLQLAVQAPTGTNAQTWRWLVITDPAIRRAVGDLYRNRPEQMESPTPPPVVADSPQQRRVSESSQYLAEHIDEVPVLVVPCAEEVGGAAGWQPSIYPAVWSFMLALRSRGLGSCITTGHLYRHKEAAALLGVPDGFAQACLLPVAYFTGDDFRPAERRPVQEITYWNHWGQVDG
jgi:nitroreductase